MEPSAFAYAERHDNIEAIYKKLEEKLDTADVTDVLKELHRIVNEAIRAAGPGEDHAEGLTIDLSQIDFEKLRKEFTEIPARIPCYRTFGKSWKRSSRGRFRTILR